MYKQHIEQLIKLVQEVDRLQTKGIIELDEDLQHQDLCDLSFHLHEELCVFD